MPLIIFKSIYNEGTDRIPQYKGKTIISNQSPPTLQSLSLTQFTHVISFDQDRMLVVNEVPIEAQRAYISAREQISEMTKSELREKDELKEELKEKEEEKSELKVIDLDEEAERLIETCEEYETVIAEMEDMVQTLLTRIETKGNVRYVTSYFFS